jgi:hypothetical protein
MKNLLKFAVDAFYVSPGYGTKRPGIGAEKPT